MAVTLFASGTQAATVGTEHFLADVNEAGVYTFHVDTINMANGDALELRIYQMVLTGGTSRVYCFEAFAGAQPADDVEKVSIPVSNDLTDSTALRFSLCQRAGTGKSYPWKILKHA